MNTENELFAELHEQEENGLFGNEHRRQYEAQQEALRLSAVSGSLREKSLEWFFAKSEMEKHDLKDKHFPNTAIQHSSQWGFHFTFGQIEEMYVKEQ